MRKSLCKFFNFNHFFSDIIDQARLLRPCLPEAFCQSTLELIAGFLVGYPLSDEKSFDILRIESVRRRRGLLIDLTMEVTDEEDNVELSLSETDDVEE
jgi:hypothetical protein